MKKWTLTILAALLALSMASCGGESKAEDTGAANNADPTVTEEKESSASSETAAAQEAEQTEAQKETEAPALQEGYAVMLEGGISIRLGAPAEAVIPTLGVYSDFMEAPSCIHDGSDRVYTYSGAYTVTTSPDAAGKEYVAEVALLSDAVGMECGEQLLMIGSPAADLEAAFGQPSEDNFGVRKYTLEGGILTATVDGDAVAALVVSYPVG